MKIYGRRFNCYFIVKKNIRTIKEEIRLKRKFLAPNLFKFYGQKNKIGAIKLIKNLCYNQNLGIS